MKKFFKMCLVPRIESDLRDEAHFLINFFITILCIQLFIFVSNLNSFYDLYYRVINWDTKSIMIGDIVLILTYILWKSQNKKFFKFFISICHSLFPILHIFTLKLIKRIEIQVILFIHFFLLFYKTKKMKNVFPSPPFSQIYHNQAASRLISIFLYAILFNSIIFKLSLLENLLFLIFTIQNIKCFDLFKSSKSCKYKKIVLRQNILNDQKNKMLLNNPEPLIIFQGKKEPFLSNEMQKLLKMLKCNSFNDFATKVKKINGANLNDILNAKELMQAENIIMHFNKKDLGKEEILLISINSIQEPDTKLISIRNISLYNEEREKQLQNKFQNLILFSGSHEMRTQLNIIKQSFRRLKNDYNLEMIYKGNMAAKIFERKMNLVVDYIHISNNQFTTENINFSPKEILRKIYNLISFQANKNIQAYYQYNTNIPYMLYGYYKRIISMLTHIALNSCKYTIHGYIRISLDYMKDKGNLIFEISDTGIGFNMDEQPVGEIKTPSFCSNNISKNFKRRQSIQPSNINIRRKQYLSGIGLASIKLICYRLKGNLIIETGPDQGTKVIIDLPVKISKSSASEIEDESCMTRVFSLNNNMNDLKEYNILKYLEYQGPSSLLKKANSSACNTIERKKDNQGKNCVLIADDIEFNREILKGIVKNSCPYQIFEAENGLKALKIVQHIASSSLHEGKLLILMDIDMPVMNGIDATMQIRTLRNNLTIFIVAVTGFENQEMRNKCMEAGMNEFHPKPISAKFIKSLINQFFK